MDSSIRKRVIIAVLLQVMQQATGINPIMSYGGLIFQDITKRVQFHSSLVQKLALEKEMEVFNFWCCSPHHYILVSSQEHGDLFICLEDC